MLSIRTDKPEAEIGLYEDGREIAHQKWQAHRELAETIHTKIKDLLISQGKSMDDIEGVAVFQGPGSFTGLRIGISVANALADSLRIPICGAMGEDWVAKSIRHLKSGSHPQIILPEYGAPPHITKPKH